jgi:serine kinase of HPr protein (carbohydrate metabolism regulator)
MSETVHGTAVLVGAQGVLIRGASGSGKSSLALALVASGGLLVADDRVHLSACHGRLVATAVAATAGRIELRGRGLVTVPHERSAVIRLIIDLVDEADLERLPQNHQMSAVLLGVTLPRQPAPAASDHALVLARAALQALGPRGDTGLRTA